MTLSAVLRLVSSIARYCEKHGDGFRSEPLPIKNQADRVKTHRSAAIPEFAGVTGSSDDDERLWRRSGGKIVYPFAAGNAVADHATQPGPKPSHSPFRPPPRPSARRTRRD